MRTPPTWPTQATLARQLDVLGTTYPAWRITRRSGMWWAIKHTEPTSAQRAAGVFAMIGRPDAACLGRALERQAEILHVTRRW